MAWLVWLIKSKCISIESSSATMKATYPDTDPNSGDGGLFGSQRSRKLQPEEKGSFGKSTRRSRSRTGTPAPKKQEDPTIAAADQIFGKYFAQQAALRASTNSHTSPSRLSNSISQPNVSTTTSASPPEGNGDASRRYIHKEPTEVILRGFKQDQQYEALFKYEQIAGRICEDYPRDPPIDQRKYKGNHRDPAVMRKALTPAEKAKALRYAGGDNWIKVTFESAEAAQIAIESSPQIILGHTIYAELYRGVPPTDVRPVPENSNGYRESQRTPRRAQGPMSRSQPTSDFGRGAQSLSPPASNSSSQTLDTATISHSSATMTNSPPADAHLYCRAIPTARRIQLLPAEQALLPQQSFNQRILSRIPILAWLSSDIIGTEVPRTADGDFDWDHASFYWRFLWWVDTKTGWFDIVTDKDE
jgi:hypothetical protein